MAVSVKRHCCETLVGVRLIVLGVVTAIANVIEAVMIANPDLLARVYVPRRRDGRLLQRVLVFPVWGDIWCFVGHSLWHAN